MPSARELELSEKTIVLPELCTFGFFQDAANRELHEIDERVAKWTWHSAVDVATICHRIIEEMKSRYQGDAIVDWTFNFHNYVDLNRVDPHHDFGTFTWFVNYGLGQFACERPPSACAFDGDPNLYIPGKFGMKVIKAVQLGARNAEWEMRWTNLRGNPFIPGPYISLASLEN